MTLPRTRIPQHGTAVVSHTFAIPVTAVTVRVLAQDGTEVTPTTTEAVGQISDTDVTYVLSSAETAIPTRLEVIWTGSDVATTDAVVEREFVDVVADVAPPTLFYATQTDLSAYSVEVPSTDGDLIDEALSHAEDDVDAYCGPWGRMNDATRLFGHLTLGENPQGLMPRQLAAVKAATCAQALYRLTVGESWALTGGDLYQSTTGPDFSTTGRRPRFSPQAKQELQGTGLLVRGASFGRRRWVA